VCEAADRRADDASTFELLARACGDERVVGGTMRVFAGLAVSSNRAMDQTGVRLEQRWVVDPEFLGYAWSEAVDHDVGAACDREEGVAIARLAQVQRGAPLAARPHTRAGERAERIALGRFDPGDAGTVAGEEHAGHRPGNAP